MQGERKSTRAPRALRGLISAFAATIVAAAAHTLAGGGAPPWWMVSVVILLALPLTVWLGGRRLSVGGTVASVAITQVLLHLAFAAVGPRAASAAGLPVHVHGEIPASLAAEASGAAGGLTSGGHLHLTPGMFAAHLVAAGATIALLLYGERLIHAVVRGWRRLVGIAFAPRPLAVPARAMTRWTAPALAATFLSVLSRRGPPAYAH